MRIILMLSVLFMVNVSLADFSPPGQGQVDAWVDLALKIPPEELLSKKGRHVCQPMTVGIEAPIGYGEDQKEAHARAGLRCIQLRCGITNQLVQKKRQELAGQKNSQLEMLFEDLGFSQEEINNIISSLGDSSFSAPEVKCQNNPLARVLAYDMCFGVAHHCGVE